MKSHFWTTLVSTTPPHPPQCGPALECDKTCLSKEAIASHYTTSCADGTLEEDEYETLLSSEEEDVPKEFHRPASEASTQTPVAPSGSHCGSPWHRPLMVDASSQTTTQVVDASTQTPDAVAEASVLTVKSPVPAALDSDPPLRTLSPGVPAYPSVGALPDVPPCKAPAQLPVSRSPSTRDKRANLETPARPAYPGVRRACDTRGSLGSPLAASPPSLHHQKIKQVPKHGQGPGTPNQTPPYTPLHTHKPTFSPARQLPPSRPSSLLPTPVSVSLPLFTADYLLLVLLLNMAHHMKPLLLQY